MLSTIRSRLSYANVTATLALFLALGGAGAYAANEWTGSNIVDESLTGLDVKNSTLYSHDVANDTLRSADVLNDSLRGGDVRDGSLTGLDVRNSTIYGHDVANDSLRGYDILESSLGRVPDSDKLDGMDSADFATDADLDALRDDAWAYVRSDGVFHASSGNLRVTHPSTGLYCVMVADRGSHKAAQVSSANPSSARFVAAVTGHGTGCNDAAEAGEDEIPVQVRDPSGTLVDSPFVIYVPPA